MIFDNSEFTKELNEKLHNKAHGGVVSFVTDTVWGVGCLPENEKGAENIYALKNRDRSKPLILMSDSVEHLLPYVKNIPPKARELMEKHFPGALTLIFEKSDKTPDYITSYKNTVGIRVPDNPVFKRLCEVVDGHVLATTSAILSHQPSAKTYEQALENMKDLADLVIPDCGHTCKGLESTVVGVFQDELKIFRQGAITIEI